MNAGLQPSRKLPEFLSSLFWEYDPEALDLDVHADAVIGRIMERGSWAAMVWLRQTYSKDRLASFLEKRGVRSLPPRELNYWAFIAGLSREKRERWVEENRAKPNAWRDRFSH
jgi:hypothetical protein